MPYHTDVIRCVGWATSRGGKFIVDTGVLDHVRGLHQTRAVSKPSSHLDKKKSII